MAAGCSRTHPGRNLGRMGIFIERPDLLVAFREARRDALEAVYQRYFDEVVTLIRRGFVYQRETTAVIPGVGDPVEQDDLIQETFVRAFSERGRQGYDGCSPYRPYLLRIAKNLMIDRLRRWQQRKRKFVDSSAHTVGHIDAILTENGAFTPEDEIELKGVQHLLAATAAYIRTLEDPLKTVVALRFQQGLSQQQAAERMQLTRRRIRTYEARLRRSLHDYLVQQGIDPFDPSPPRERNPASAQTPAPRQKRPIGPVLSIHGRADLACALWLAVC